MPLRLRLFDLRQTRLPQAVGLCAGDITGLAQVVNEAQLSLLHCKEVSGDGWYGTWAEIEFTASRANPTVILPREVARLEQIDVCGHPIQVNNQFYEYLQFGNGRMRQNKHRNCTTTEAFSRNNAVTQFELLPTPQLLQVYITDPQDVGKRILLQGVDNTGTTIYSQDILNQVQGIFVPFAFPFSTAPMEFSRITGVQKDVTVGPVQVFQVDPTTGVQSLILTMEPGEQTAWYRRYQLDPLPWNCCNIPALNPAQNIVHLTAIAMLEMIPVAVDTDYLLIQEPNAIVLEAQSIRMSMNDSDSARTQSLAYHRDAVRLLIGQCTRYLGQDDVAIQYRPFGSATLARAGVGYIT
jgi:hypothetical protein